METPYQPIQLVYRWNCCKISLFVINFVYLLTALTLIIWGVMSQLFTLTNASFLSSYGFSYSQYAHYLYIFGAVLLPISCLGILIAFRHSIRTAKLYLQLLASLMVFETFCVLGAISLFPVLQLALWNIIQHTIDQCDTTSVAYYAIAYLQMSFQCCGLNYPGLGKTNDTRIETSCYSKDKYTVYDSYCKPERYYEINCFYGVYNDVLGAYLNILMLATILIATQLLTFKVALIHIRCISFMKNNYAMREYSSSINS